MSQWVVVVPVKRLAGAKSRLRGVVDDARHGDLALAMLRDTLAAVLACPQVAESLVVTDDPVVTTAARTLGAHPVPNPAAAGLNAAVQYGADVAAGLHRWRAVLAGDLPGLRPTDLSEVLRAAARPARCFVADADGTGSVLLTAPPGLPLDPHFGPGSAAAHASSGAVRLIGGWPAMRRDVDTPDDLRAVLSLGAGAHTTAMLARIRDEDHAAPTTHKGLLDEQLETGCSTGATCGSV